METALRRPINKINELLNQIGDEEVVEEYGADVLPILLPPHGRLHARPSNGQAKTAQNVDVGRFFEDSQFYDFAP